MTVHRMEAFGLESEYLLVLLRSCEMANEVGATGNRRFYYFQGIDTEEVVKHSKELSWYTYGGGLLQEISQIDNGDTVVLELVG